MNKTLLLGNMVRDIEIKNLQNDKKVGNFTLAVKRESNREKVDFIQCTAWNKTAEVLAKYTKKGSQVLVEGELNIDKVNDQYYTKVTITKVELLGKSENTETQRGETQFTKQEVSQVDTTTKEPEFEDFETVGFDISESDMPF